MMIAYVPEKLCFYRYFGRVMLGPLHGANSRILQYFLRLWVHYEMDVLLIAFLLLPWLIVVAFVFIMIQFGVRFRAENMIV
mgnify:CR=1 FL=1